MNAPSPLEAIFFAALEKPSPAERAAFLDQACAGSDELRRSVERMLAAQADLGSFLEHPPAAPDVACSEPTCDEPTREAAGTVIGPYKLLEQIGEGGMGVVYMADQQAPVRRRVALKIIKPGMDTHQVIARFEAERQALALMDHPNIARVLDAGATDSGRPYFVMELVRGIPITDYCDQNNLPVHERLDLFIHVCHAVQHAHQKGIIHRDLKPSNVLVTLHDGRPVPKVIDFGVAKATNQQLTERTLFTNFAQMVGTPLYMSPEQAEMTSLDIDTRSDIYSLGVLLYELLTGTTPVDKEQMKQAAFDEVRRIIREEEAQTPSARISGSQTLPAIAAHRHIEPTRLSKLVRGDLDWIAMKCLEKDRTRRYETANGLAMDIQRYLADEPVEARHPSATYRFGKFARRNKRALSTVAVLALAVLVVAGTLGWAFRDREAHAQDAARDRAARETEIETEVTAALQEAERWQKQEKWPEALSAVKQAEGLLTAGGSDELRERVHQLRKDLEMVLRLEEIPLPASQEYGKWWDWETEDRAYRQAFADYGIDVLSLPVDEAAARIRARPGVAVQLAVALDVWDSCQDPRAPADRPTLAAVAQAADPDQWRRQVRQAVQRRDRAALATLATSPELPRQPTASVLLLARALLRSGGLVQANEILRQAQRLHPDDFWLNSYLAFTVSQIGSSRRADSISFYRAALAVRPHSCGAHYILGRALSVQGKLDEAIACQQKAIELDPKFYLARINLGYALRNQGKLDEAIACCEKAIELDSKRSEAYSNLGFYLKEQGKLDEAIACYLKAIDRDPNDAGAHAALGNALRQKGQLVEAVACYQKAIPLYKKVIARDPNDADAHINLGYALNQQGKRNEAIAYYKKAIELDVNNTDAHCGLGDALIDENKLAEAIACFRKAIDLDPKRPGPYHALGSILQDQKKLDEAVELHRKAVELEPKYARAHAGLGDVLRLLGKHDEAIACYKKAIELDPKLAYADYTLGLAILNESKQQGAVTRNTDAIELHPKDSGGEVDRGVALTQEGKLDEAVACYKRAIELDPKNIAAHNNLGNILRQQGKRDEALAYLDKAVKLGPSNDAPWHNRGLVYLDLKQHDKALADFAKVIELKPDHVQAWGFRHRVYMDLKKYDQAVVEYSKAIDLKPENAVAWYYRGLVCGVYLNQHDQAITDYSEAIKLKPDYLSAFSARAESHRTLKQWDKAIADYSEAIRLNPEDYWAFRGRSATYHALKQWDKAIADYSELIKFKPTRGSFIGRSLAYTELKQWDKAIADKTKALELSPTSIRHNSLARFLINCPDLKFRDAPRAVELAKRALELSSVSNSGHYWNTLGLAYYRAGDWKHAIGALETSMNFRKEGHSNDWFFLAMAHWQLGNKDEARKWYAQAIAWMDKNQPTNEELLRFRAEAEELLTITDEKPTIKSESN